MEFTTDCHPQTQTGACPIDDEYHCHSKSRSNSFHHSSISARKSVQNTNPPNESSIESTVTSLISSPHETALSNSPVYHVEHRYETYCRTNIDIVELIKQWQLGHVSNFDYLLILNALAGRKFHDPNNHLIFPWINDFTSPIGNLRDLSQSKYRLNKGFVRFDF